MTSKGPGDARSYADAAKDLRIGILHARWNSDIIEKLVSGCLSALTEGGVQSDRITVQSVPGSFELPLGVQRMHAASNTTTSTNLVSAASDLLGGGATDLASSAANATANPNTGKASGPFDAIVAIGVLIKGKTMHFEYISDAVSHGLMRVQLDTGVPVVFGLLTCLDQQQALTRAGVKPPGGSDAEQYGEQGHNHGEDWGRAAIEMAVKRKGWGEGNFVE